MREGKFRQVAILKSALWRRRPVADNDDPLLQAIASTPPFGGMPVTDAVSRDELVIGEAPSSLVIACLADGDLQDRATRSELEALKSRGHVVIVYASASGELATTALAWISEGLVADFVDQSGRNSAYAFQHSGKLIWNGSPIYPPIACQTQAGNSAERVFVAMPLGERHETIYENFVEPALEAAGLKSTWCRSRVLPGALITDKIREMIRAANFLIALVPDNAKPNQINNVLYEAGIAHGAGRGVLIATDKDPREWRAEGPIDLISHELIEYRSPMELCLRLYFGLKPKGC